MNISRRLFSRQLAIGGAAAGAVATLGGAHDADAGPARLPAPGAEMDIRYKDIHFVFYSKAGDILHRSNIGHAYNGIFNRYRYVWTGRSDDGVARTRTIAVIEAWSGGKLLMRHVQDFMVFPGGDIIVDWHVDCTERLPIHEWPSHVPQPPPFSPEVT
jgi:hypothetical protein